MFLLLLLNNSDTNGRNANRVVLYEDASKKQLQEFIAALRGCQVMMQACSSLSFLLASTESHLLQHLLTPGSIQYALSPNNLGLIVLLTIVYFFFVYFCPKMNNACRQRTTSCFFGFKAL